MRYLLGYKEDLNWAMALCISILVSITDPVDVVHMLKHMGAS